MLKAVFASIPNLIIRFVKRYGIKHELFTVPKDLLSMGNKMRFMACVKNIIALTFAYLLKLTNMAIESKLILLGIVLFMLYGAKDIIRETFSAYESNEGKKYDLIFDDDIILRGSQIITRISEKVLVFDKKTNVYKIMSNEACLNTIKHYLTNLWLLRINKKFQIFDLITAVIMLLITIITNDVIPQVIFIPLLLAFGVFSFISASYIANSRKSYYKESRNNDNEQHMLSNDLLRVPLIVKQDLSMRIGKLKDCVLKNSLNIRSFHKKVNISYIIMSILETLCSHAIIILYLINVDWNTISIATIAEITANLVIIETALGYIRNLTSMLESNANRIGDMLEEEEDVKRILEVYDKENVSSKDSKPINVINVPPFSIKYIEESENDKPFTLKSTKDIKLKIGDVAVLYGVSGSGKSTFMKMITERIKLEKTTEIPSTSRYLYFDEKLKFGSLSIYDEIFCLEKNPDHLKMQEILTSLHLWQEISNNCIDVWQYLKEKKYNLSFSNGQKQRLILAKMLYWLDDEIDVVVLDECTSGLDDKSEELDSADAQRILEYVVRCCNKDKKRIVVLSTHQNIDEFKKNVQNDFNIHNLYFSKKEDCNYVEM